MKPRYSTACAASASFVLAASLSLATAGPLTERTTPFPDDWPYAAPWHLDRQFLIPSEKSRILFVVEHVSGHKPDARALDSLVHVAAKYGERPAAWISSSDPQAPHVSLSAGQDPRIEGSTLSPDTLY